ncbi:hypothetical protein LTR09_006509 [Extremus antarcticus]|uniref:Uncharacterized protein n=1 Tax=Extremus antarcticus TaxID=702011 RepID=A0AAJ0DE14_9PEZI|nr:hypothetical protein LTR09_006509 [Extremus antarcticus]
MASQLPGAVFRIELETRQRITIATSLNDDVDLTRCNSQAQSPLFNKTPPEVRNLIFYYASQLDRDSPIANTDFSLSGSEYQEYRDTNAGLKPFRYHTAPLETCRQIWLEANHLSFQQAIYNICCTSQHPCGSREDLHTIRAKVDRHVSYLESLTPNNRPNLEHVRIPTHVCLPTDTMHMEWPSQVLRRLNHPTLRNARHFTTLGIVTLAVRFYGWEDQVPRVDCYFGWIEDFVRRLAGLAIPTIRLELEVPVSGSDRIETLVEEVEELKMVKEFHTEFDRGPHGLRRGPNCLVLQPLTEKRSQVGPSHAEQVADGHNPVEGGNEDEGDGWRVYTLIWKLETSDSYFNRAHSASKARTEAKRGEEGAGKVLTGADEAANRYRQLWAKQGSLLRFADDK